MKLAQTEKLYSKLNPIEQGNLTFEAIVRRDRAEADAISGAVNRVSYIMAHVDFCQRTRGLIELSLMFGMSYWKNNTRFLQVGNLESKEGSLFFLGEIAALDAALIEVCKQLNVDINAVRKLASCEGELHTGEFANPERVDLWVNEFMGIFR